MTGVVLKVLVSVFDRSTAANPLWPSQRLWEWNSALHQTSLPCLWDLELLELLLRFLWTRPNDQDSDLRGHRGGSLLRGNHADGKLPAAILPRSPVMSRVSQTLLLCISLQDWLSLCSVCEVGCLLSDWSSWSECSASCGGGVSTRNKTVLREAEAGGKGCDGPLEQHVVCNTNRCLPGTPPNKSHCDPEGSQSQIWIHVLIGLLLQKEK